MGARLFRLPVVSNVLLSRKNGDVAAEAKRRSPIKGRLDSAYCFLEAEAKLLVERHLRTCTGAPLAYRTGHHQVKFMSGGFDQKAGSVVTVAAGNFEFAT